jgi:acetate kinase
MRAEGEILVFNAGSSSVMIAGFSDDRPPQQLWSGAVERIGLSNGRFHIRLAGGAIQVDETRSMPDHQAAFDTFFRLLEELGQDVSLRAIGHRVVHGGDTRAVEAIEFFCYQVRKHFGALTAVLGGLDRLVFTGGIGANAAAIRAKICDGLEYFWVPLDDDRNYHGDRVISRDDSKVRVEVVSTDEELMITRHIQRLLPAAAILRRP